MLAGADENLVAGDGVAAVRVRLGLGAQQAEIGAAVRLGQAHGAGPFAGRDLRAGRAPLFGRAVLVQAFVGAVREARYIVHA